MALLGRQPIANRVVGHQLRDELVNEQGYRRARRNMER